MFGAIIIQALFFPFCNILLGARNHRFEHWYQAGVSATLITLILTHAQIYLQTGCTIDDY